MDHIEIIAKMADEIATLSQRILQLEEHLDIEVRLRAKKPVVSFKIINNRVKNLKR